MFLVGTANAWVAAIWAGTFMMSLKRVKDDGAIFFPGGKHVEGKKFSIVCNNDLYLGPSSWRRVTQEPTDY